MKKLSMKELKEKCRERDEKMSGSKNDLVARLLQKRKPEILISRSRRSQYVPRVPSSNAAVVVALLLHHEPGTPPLSKDKIMMLAEETGISKDPMFGNGKSWYDGWSGMKVRYAILMYLYASYHEIFLISQSIGLSWYQDLTGGDPPLVSVVKRKYSLTTQPTGAAGVDVAKALHTLAHRQNLCR